MGKIKDLTGQKINKLLVIKQVSPPEGKKPGVYWECLCDCGNIIVVQAACLRNGQKSCGCIRKEINYKDLTGQKFGRLTALYSKEAVNGHKIWHCKCECGNECDISASCLTRKKGSTKSCGCLNKETALQSLEIARQEIIIDLTNKRFGKLIALERISGTSTKSAKWKCQCDCGNILYIETARLISGKTLSCGCLRSKGEEKVTQILTKQNINFEFQKTYENLLSEKHYKLRFDYYLPEYNCCIEYQGRQHYLKEDYYYSEEGQIHDQLKRDFCKNNNIKLIEIPYWDYDKLNWGYIKERLNG